MIALDAAWRAANPLPTSEGGTSKNSRGRVLAIGGATSVPGAIALTGEAALRVGAGKVQIATVRSAALMIGVRFPEIRVVPLGEDDGGEIAADPNDLLTGALERTDVAVIGPGMGSKDAAAALVARVAGADAPVPLVLDAAAVACAGSLQGALAGRRGRLILTPHPGEMASLLDCAEEEVERDLSAAASEAARRFGAVVALKSTETVIADGDGQVVRYEGGGVGLATGGSGDVLAGAVGGLLSRGAPPLVATAWAVWLHGEAGRTLAMRTGPIGFLARELLPILPGLMPR